MWAVGAALMVAGAVFLWGAVCIAERQMAGLSGDELFDLVLPWACGLVSVACAVGSVAKWWLG